MPSYPNSADHIDTKRQFLPKGPHSTFLLKKKMHWNKIVSWLFLFLIPNYCAAIFVAAILLLFPLCTSLFYSFQPESIHKWLSCATSGWGLDERYPVNWLSFYEQILKHKKRLCFVIHLWVNIWSQLFIILGNSEF